MSQRHNHLLSLQEAMDLLGVSRATIDRWRRDKQLPHIKIGKEILVDKHKLDTWIQMHSRANPIHQPYNRVFLNKDDRGRLSEWGCAFVESAYHQAIGIIRRGITGNQPWD